MPNDLLITALPYIVIFAASDILAGYAAYLALSVRRGLVIPVYRSRALWTAVLAFLLGAGIQVSGNVAQFIPSEFYTAAAILVYLGLLPGIIAVIFIYIDRTIKTIIRLDYLRKDLLGWSRFRMVYWVFVSLQFFLYFLYLGTPYGPLLITIAYTLVLLVPLTYGSAAIVLGSRRTRDLTFRSHAKWFAYCILTIILSAVVYDLTPDLILDSLPFPLASFCLYKMAKYLVPVSRIGA